MRLDLPQIQSTHKAFETPVVYMMVFNSLSLSQLRSSLSFSLSFYPFDAIETSKINTVDWHIGGSSLSGGWWTREIFETVKENGRDRERKRAIRNETWRGYVMDFPVYLDKRRTTTTKSLTPTLRSSSRSSSPGAFAGTRKCCGALHVSQIFRSMCVRSPGTNCKNESDA